MEIFRAGQASPNSRRLRRPEKTFFFASLTDILFPKKDWCVCAVNVFWVWVDGMRLLCVFGTVYRCGFDPLRKPLFAGIEDLERDTRSGGYLLPCGSKQDLPFPTFPDTDEVISR